MNLELKSDMLTAQHVMPGVQKVTPMNTLQSLMNYITEMCSTSINVPSQSLPHKGSAFSKRQNC